MCNPRRVTVTATRELAQAWEREVARTVELDAEVVGEARLRQPLGDTLGTPVRNALARALEAGDAAWKRVAEGYRHEVEGGYALYHSAAGELEIVATRTATATAEGSASTRLAGTVRGALDATGEGSYYDDGWGGHTEKRAAERAQQEADARLEAAARRRLERAQADAEADAEVALAARAAAAARAALEARIEDERQTLERQAAAQLEAVGLRCRQAFHQLLGRAYREAILAYARRRGAEVVADHDEGGVIEIELRLASG